MILTVMGLFCSCWILKMHNIVVNPIQSISFILGVYAPYDEIKRGEMKVWHYMEFMVDMKLNNVHGITKREQNK
ncbi:MAG: hypothetical protein YK1309IOTA_680015 [Marine Group I thaumarchaeote]|nr:MAG: hypothetical protein YK1309IOTA_680015 [Marine Group I thaumarchaeote]